MASEGGGVARTHSGARYKKNPTVCLTFCYSDCNHPFAVVLFKFVAFFRIGANHSQFETLVDGK